MGQKTVFIVVTGRVQGVGFRYFAKLKAGETGIKGWIRNTSTGAVELEVCGEPTDLDCFIDWIKTGPSRAIIKNVSVTEIRTERMFTEFSIR
jgi:acylphosphatase